MYQAVMANRISQTDYPKNYSTVKTIGAVGGIGGGLFLMLTGIILSVVSYFQRLNFHRLDLILLVASFAALAIGAHSLDLLDDEKKARRIEYCRKTGLKD